MDESDVDVRMFLSYFLAAIQSLFPKTELSAEVLLETNQKLSAIFS
jgi:ATP/maltotriose-dependent transcriptional regulator MalT